MDRLRLDLSASWGIPGWIDDGTHYRLSEIIERYPEHKEELVRKHLNGMLLLHLCQLHLRSQLHEVLPSGATSLEREKN